MSECVVRMEMPLNCLECPMYDYNRHKLCCNAHFDLRPIPNGGVPKPDWCPILCQLPEEHGRLIDADAFEKDVSDALVYGLREIPSEEGKQIFHVLMQEVLDNVKKRETIVPAERSET